MSGSEAGSIVPIAQDTASHHSHGFAERIETVLWAAENRRATSSGKLEEREEIRL